MLLPILITTIIIVIMKDAKTAAATVILRLIGLNVQAQVSHVQPGPWQPEFLYFLLSSTLLRGVEVWREVWQGQVKVALFPLVILYLHVLVFPNFSEVWTYGIVWQSGYCHTLSLGNEPVIIPALLSSTLLRCVELWMNSLTKTGYSHTFPPVINPLSFFTHWTLPWGLEVWNSLTNSGYTCSRTFLQSWTHYHSLQCT